MKRTLAEKRRFNKRQDRVEQQPAPGKRRSWSRAILLFTAFFLACVGTWAFCEFVLWNRLPAELVGKWVVVGGPQDGATFDFFRNGTMEGNVNFRDTNKPFYAVIRVEGKNIFTTTQHPLTGTEDTQVKIIRTLTAKNLVVEDEQGTVTQLERAE